METLENKTKEQMIEKEKELQKNIRLLSETAMKFVELPSDENIYGFIGEQLIKLIGKDSYIVINSVDEKQEVSTTRAVLGVGKFIDKITKLLGKHPVGMTVNIQRNNMYYMSNCKMHLYTEGLYGILLQTVPKAICTSIEKLLKIDKIYTLDFIKGEKLLGTAVVFLKEGAEEIKNMEIIETFIKQASIAIRQRMAEEALKEINENFQQVVSNITTVIWKADIGNNGAFENTYCSPVIDELLGLPAGTIKNDWDKYFSYIKPEYLERVKNAFREAIISPGKKIDCEYEVLKENEQTAWLHSNGRCFEKNGKLHVFGSTTDITEQKNVAEKIKAKSLFLESLIQQSPLPTFVMDSKGFNVMVNEAFLKFYAVPNKEMILGRNALTEPANIKQGVVKYFKEALSGKIVETPEKEFVSPYKNKKTNTRSRMFPILDPTGTMTNVVVMQEDITDRKQAEEELHKSETQYKNLYSMMRLMCDNLPDLIWTKDMEGKFLFVNKACAEILLDAKDTDEPINKTDIYFADRMIKSHPEIPDYLSFGKKCIESDFTVLKTRKPTRFDESGNVKGKFLYLDVYKAPFENENGDLIGTVGCAKVVTKEKQMEKKLRENEEKYRLLAENTLDCIWKTDKNLRFTYVNPSIYAMFGFTPEEWVGSTLAEHCSMEEMQRIMGMIAEDMKNESYSKTLEMLLIHKDGREIPVEIKSKILVNEKKELIGLQGTTIDITKRKKAEKELKKHREHLKELVKERTKELEEKTKKLEKSQQAMTYLVEDVNDARIELNIINNKLNTANKEMESFSYSVSHDLRAPLRSIDGFSKILLEDYHAVLEKQGKHYLQRVRAGTQKMGQLIDDLLNLSRIGRQPLNKNTTNLKTIANEVYQLLESERKNRKVKFTVHECPETLADPNLMQNVFLNLLSNALKFTKNKPLTEIEFGCKEKDNKTIFFIKDNGVGFDMKFANKLFSPFQRLHSNEEYEGSGIGLAIVQRIIIKHGGEIWVESVPDKGTTFYFKLDG